MFCFREIWRDSPTNEVLDKQSKKVALILWNTEADFYLIKLNLAY